jgi:hypothetical protein
LFSLPHSWNSFKRYHFSISMHVYKVFTLYSLFKGEYHNPHQAKY